MISLKEFKSQYELGFKVEKSSLSIRSFSHTVFDLDVYLPSLDKNLQRDFVWSLDQQRELILSILLDRNIPPLSILCINDDENDRDIYQVIDGKQRLSTIIKFLNNEFSIIIENKEYLYSDLDKDYIIKIRSTYLDMYIAYDNIGEIMPDDFKIRWFKLINYAGTDMDKQHMNQLMV